MDVRCLPTSTAIAPPIARLFLPDRGQPQGLRNRYPILKPDALRPSARVPCCALRSKSLNETSAKEGDVPVATARPFPFQNTTTAPRQSAAADKSPRRRGLAEASPATPPLLARIPDVTIGPRRLETTPSADRPADSAVQYRYDSAHVSTARDVSTRLRKSRQSAKQRTSESGLQELSTTIRFGVKAWELVQSYPSAVRAVGMFLLTVVTGTSMMLMMGHRSAPGDFPPTADQPPATATSEPTWPTKPAAEPTTIDHEPAGATTLVPTAIGPTGLTNQPPQNLAATTSAGPLQTVEASAPPSEPLPRLQTDEPQITRCPAVQYAPASDYPSTSLPEISAESIPPAVARLSGNIVEAQSR